MKGNKPSPRVAPAARENGIYFVLTLFCSVALAVELWAGFKSAGDGLGFLQFVRQLLA